MQLHQARRMLRSSSKETTMREVVENNQPLFVRIIAISESQTLCSPRTSSNRLLNELQSLAKDEVLHDHRTNEERIRAQVKGLGKTLQKGTERDDNTSQGALRTYHNPSFKPHCSYQSSLDPLHTTRQAKRPSQLRAKYELKASQQQSTKPQAEARAAVNIGTCVKSVSSYVSHVTAAF